MCWLCVCVWWLQVLQVLKGHNGAVYAVALSGDGSKIVSGSGDNTVRVWSAATGQASAFCASHRSQFASLHAAFAVLASLCRCVVALVVRLVARACRHWWVNDVSTGDIGLLEASTNESLEAQKICEYVGVFV